VVCSALSIRVALPHHPACPLSAGFGLIYLSSRAFVFMAQYAYLRY